MPLQNDGNYNGNNNRNNLYDDRVNPYFDRNVYSGRNPYDNNRNQYDDNNRYNGYNDQNRYNDGRPQDPRNPFNDDRGNRYNSDRPYDPRNPPQYNDDYDDRNRYTNREYEQQRLELERRNRLEDANLQRILDDVDKLASSECSANVGAQWNFETNVNEATQQESVCIKIHHTQDVDLQTNAIEKQKQL